MKLETMERPVPIYARTPPGLPAVNQPDIAVAQHWMHDLDLLVRKGLVGYDPFDVKAHPLLRKVQRRPLLRKASTGMCDLFPHLTRQVLGIAPTENPKAHALVAMGRLRLFAITQREEYLALARENLAWLDQHATEGFSGPCWGYPFRVYGTGVDSPPGSPVLVVSAIAGQAYLEAWRITQETAFLEAARGIAQFILQDVPRLDESDGAFCFAYTPQDRRRVHNASLLGVEHCVCTAAASGDDALAEAVMPALHFTVEAQMDDGAWPYGAWAEGEPYEPGLMALVDHHHTGFVLRSLHAIDVARPAADLGKVIDRGFAYYRKQLYGPFGMPLDAFRQYPVDIHACAESVLCPSVLSERRRTALSMATLGMRWAHWYLRRPSDGAPYYRKYKRFTSRITYPRWGTAWMYRAVAEYLVATSGIEDAGHIAGKTW